MNFDPYEVLNVTQNATESEIKKARNQLARRFHPDKLESNNENDQNFMKLINLACDILCDPEKKRKHFEKNEPDNFEYQHGARPAKHLLKLPGYNFRSNKFRELINTWTQEAKLKRYKMHTIRQLYISISELNEFANKRQLDFNYDLFDIYESMQPFLSVLDGNHENSGLYLMKKGEFYNLTQANRSYSQNSRVETKLNSRVPIVDLSLFEEHTLKSLLLLLDSDKLQQLKRKNKKIIIEALKTIIPMCNAEKVVVKEESKKCMSCKNEKEKGFFNIFERFLFDCIMCGDWFCNNCLQQSHKIPKLGYKVGKICRYCFEKNEKWEVECWVNTACQCLEDGHINRGLNLFHLALDFQRSHTGIDIITMMRTKLKTPNVLIFLIFDLLYFDDLNEQIKQNYLIDLARTIRKIGDARINQHEMYECYYQAVKCFHLVSDFKKVKEELDVLQLLIKSLIEKIDKINSAQLNAEIFTKMNQLIYAYNSKNISDYIINLKTINDKLALVKYFEKMSYEELNEVIENKLLFARGVYKIFHGNTIWDKINGFQDVETAFWHGWTNEEAILQTFVDVLVKAIEMKIPLPFESLVYYPEALYTLIPTQDDLKPILERIWPQITMKSINLRPLRRYEDAIAYNFDKSSNWTYLDAIYAYIDLIDSCNSIHEIIFCYLNAGFWALEAMNKCNDAIQQYCMSRLVFKCMDDASTLAHGFLDTASKACVFRFAFAAAYHANRFEIESDYETVKKLMKMFLYGCSVFPVFNIPVIQVAESMILMCELRELSDAYFKKLKELNEPKPTKECFIQYINFENAQNGISERDNIEEVKLNAMDSLLIEHGISWEDVEAYIDYRLIARDENGWLDNKKYLIMNKLDGGFYRFNGFNLNTKDHMNDLQIIAEKESFLVNFNIWLHKSALFTWTDIQTIIANFGDLRLCFFSLDPIDEKFDLHPFQNFRYEPKCMKGSMILQTIFHTDYLLKQFSMGVEVSSKPPFKQREATIYGLYKGLPDHLIEALKPIHKRGVSFHKLRRFWIQADEIEVNIIQNESEFKVLFGDVKMSVRTHPLMVTHEGKLVDSASDFDEESPEIKFANDFTRNYDEISNYYREFARLKEICKLQYMGLYLQNYHEHLKNAEKELLSDTTVNRLMSKLNIPLYNLRNTDAFRQYENLVKSKLNSFEGWINGKKRAAQALVKSTLPKQNEWVPALFKDREKGFIYGGVLLAPKVKQTVTISSGHGQSYPLNTSPFPQPTAPVKKFVSNQPYTPSGIVKPQSGHILNRNLNTLNPINEIRRYITFLASKLPDEDQPRFKRQIGELLSEVNANKRGFRANNGEGVPSMSYRRYEDERNKNYDAEKLKKEWSRIYNKPWPVETLSNGKQRDYEVHHIIELINGGTNSVNNIIPLTRDDHRGSAKNNSVHFGKDSPLRNLGQFMSNCCSLAMPNYKSNNRDKNRK